MRQIPLIFLTALTLVTSQIQSGAAQEWWTDPKTGKQYTDVKKKGKPVMGNQQACIALGAVLPEPRSSHESDFLAMQDTTEPFRLGLKWTGSAPWRWDSDGTEVGWTNWIDPEKQADGHLCVMTGIKEGNNIDKNKWKGVECSTREGISSVVCEKGPTQGNEQATTEQSVTQGGANATTGQSSRSEQPQKKSLHEFRSTKVFTGHNPFFLPK